MKKLLLLFAVLLGTVGAWGFSLPYNQSSWNVFWKSAAGETLNESLTHASCSGSVYFHESNIFLTGTGTVSITFDYTTGTKKIVILGVEVIDPNEGTVLYSDYHIGESGSIDSKNTYTFDVTETEKRQCKIRYYVCHESGDHALNLTTGQIHVSGPVEEVPIETELSTEYYYTIKNVSHSSFLSAASDYALALPSNQINYQVKSMWALEKDESTGKYKLRNAMYNNYLGHIATDNKAWPMKSQQEATNFSVNVEVEEVESHPAYITICYDDNADHGCAHDANWGSSYNWKQIVGWESTASASQWIFTKTDVPTSTRYEMVSLTYSFVYNGVEKFTQRCNEVVVGFPYPDIIVLFPLGITAANKPDGNVPSEVNGTTVTIQLSENVPFEYYSSYEEIRRWYYLKFDSNNNCYLYNKDGQSYISLDRKALEIGDIDSHAWAFVGNPFDGYKIYNKATGAAKILSSSTTMTGNTGDGTYPVLTETPIPKGNNELWYATASSHATNGFFLEQKGHSSNKLNNRGKLAYWTGGAGTGSTFVVENAIPVKLTTDDSNPIFYALKTGRTFDSKEWWYNYDSTDGRISLTQFDGSDAQWWYFKGKLVDNKVCVQLVPKSDNTKFMSYEGSGNGAEKIIAKPDETTGYTNTWRFAFKGGRYVLQTSDGQNYLSQNSGSGKKMGLWSGSPESDGGTALYVYEPMLFDLTDMAGNEYKGTSYYELESLAPPIFRGSHALTFSNIVRGNTFVADVDFGLPVSKEDGSADNLLLMTPFDSENTLKYYVENDNVLVNNSAFTSANVDNYQWAIYPCLSGNEFSFVIKNHSAGKYIKTNKTESYDKIDDEGAVTVVGNIEDATHFTFEANNRFKIPGYNLRMSVTSSETSQQDVTVHSGHGGCNTYFTVVSDIVNEWKSQYEGFFGYVGGYPLDTEDDFNNIDTYTEYLEFQEENKNKVLTLVDGEVFKIKCKDSGRGSMVYSAVDGKGSADNVFLAGTTSTYFPSLDTEGVYDEWAFVTIDAKNYLFNVQNKKFVSLQGESLEFKDNGTPFVLESIQGPVWALKFEGTSNHYLCFSPGYESTAVRVTGNIADDGNRFYLQKTSETIDDNDFLYMKELHFAGKLNAWKAQNIALLGYVGAYPAKLHDAINAVSSYNDIHGFETQHTTDIIPLTEGYYYIKGTGVGGGMSNYVNLKDQNSKKALWTETQNEADLSADNIFRFVAAGDNKYKIQSYSNGKYLQLKVAANNADNNSYLDYSYNDGYAFTFTDMGIAKHQILDGNGGVMRTEGGSAQINSWSGETTETWYLIQAPELPLTIHSTGYSTFSAAVDVKVPEGVTAYYAKEQIGDSHIRMNPVTAIPANEGVVIKGTGGETVKFPIISKAADLPAENLLKAHLNTEAVTPEDGNSVFIMATKNGETGFYPLSTTNNVIGGHKSYLEIPSTSAARLSIVWDDTETGIFETEGGEQNAEIYDLTGRRLDKPTKGVNVVGGKLVIK